MFRKLEPFSKKKERCQGTLPKSQYGAVKFSEQSLIETEIIRTKSKLFIVKVL
jgi:hypothetical protein